MAQSSKGQHQKQVVLSRALQDECAHPSSLPNITEDMEIVLGAAILVETSHKEHGQAWQKPEEVKRVEGSGKLPIGKCRPEQATEAGMIVGRELPRAELDKPGKGAREEAAK